MVVTIVILFVLLLLNGIFAMSELAMMTSRQSRLQQAASSGNKGAAAALLLSREPSRFLSTVQVGITLIGVLMGAFGEKQLSGYVRAFLEKFPLVAEHAEVIALAIVVLFITYFSLVLGELVPKRLALTYPESIAALISRPLSVLSKIAAAPVRVLTFSTDLILATLRVKPISKDDVSEEDVKSLVARAASTGIFDPIEYKLFQRVFRVGDLRVSSLMVPRADMVWIDETDSIEAVRVLIGTSPFSHFPVCKGDLDKLVGVIHVKDLIAYGLLSGGDFAINQVARKPLYVPETTPALMMLENFQKSKTHIAIVVDEYGGTQGLVTLNDIVGAVVGDVSRNSSEPLPQSIRRKDGSWLLDGSLPLHELALTLHLTSEMESQLPDANTVAGLLLDQFGHIPSAGDETTWQGYSFEVMDMDGTRIDKVLVRRVDEPPPPPQT